MKKKIKWVGMLAGTCALACGFGVYNASRVQATANETAALWDGFAITATAVRTQDPVGLRFKTDVERLTPTMKKYNPDAEYYTILTLTTGGKEYTTTRYADVWRPDGSGWNTVLLDIPESDYATQVTAQSFVKLNGKEQAFYQTEPVTISIAQTAAAVISHGTSETYIGEYIENIVTGVTLNKTTASIEEGQVVSLTATTTPSGYMAKWTSSDTSVATVDNKGNVKAKAIGTATITAEINGYTATCQVTVNARTETLTGFASSASVSRYTNMKISGTWLDTLFADERVDAFTFTMNSSRATTLSAVPFAYTISLTANTDTMATFTRSMYEVWKVSGASNFEYKGSNSLSATIKLSNFQKLWAEEESETLTKELVEALGNATPENDYKYNSHKFDFFGYSSLTDGTYVDVNGEQLFGGEDFRNVYRIEEYKDAGMSILFPQSACAINKNEGDTFDFSTSKLKAVMDMSLAAGMKRVIVSDYRLYGLVGAIMDDATAYPTDEELEKQIRAYMRPYVAHAAFYGVQLPDEPGYTAFEAYGRVYRAIKRCYPNAYLQCNLYPPVGGTVGSVFPTPAQATVAKYTAQGIDSTHAERFAAYEEYLKMFLDETGADYIMYDQYPLRDSGIYECYVGGMQVAASVCAERGVDFKFVSQTQTMDKPSDNDPNERILTEEDLRWLNNMQLGFGAKELAYYTYFTRDNGFRSDGTLYEKIFDNGSFINRDGTKTDLYYAMREILAENQAFASTILSFDYQTSATYIANGYGYNITNALSCTKGNFAKVSNVSVNTESALVSELYDDFNNRYMYMVQNITDSRLKTAGTSQTVKLTFNENYEYAEVWKNGERSIVKLENNTYVVKQNSGEAVYVIPFNASEDIGVNVDTNLGDTIVMFPTKENYDGWIKEGILTDTATGDCIVFFPGVDEDMMPWEKIG